MPAISTFIIDRFEEAALQNPNSTALLLEDSRTLSYSELNAVANNLSVVISHYLNTTCKKDTDDGVGTPLVALLMARDVATVAAMLAVGKSQAAYVPVDPAFPPDRQSHIFSHSQCQLLIADNDSYAAAASLGVIFPPTIVVEASSGKVLRWPDGGTVAPAGLPPSSSYNPKLRNHNQEALMYVLYTSGSTGKPKGVMVKQVGVINIVNWFAEQLGVTNASRVMCLTTFCFDISVLELYLPLICGGVSVLAKSSSQKNPFALLDLVNSSKCTVFQATPTTYEMMFATGWNGDPSIDFLVGGEAFRPTLLPLAGNCRSLRNVYGPTETTIWSSSFTVPKSLSLTPPGTAVSIPIGSVISETVFYLVAEGKQPWTQVTGKDAEGELWIGGIGVARGYLHAPDLTEKVFLQNPFDPSLGFVYRTGDIVRKLDDGSDAFVFVRRMDDQVKIDGFRIELQEIEAVYMQHESVDKAVALVRGGNKLIIYIKSSDTHVGTLSQQQLSQITAFASRSLTYYMVPKYTIVVDSFPQTANGKLDRKALRDPNPEDVTPKLVQDEKSSATPANDSTESSGVGGSGMEMVSSSFSKQRGGSKGKGSDRSAANKKKGGAKSSFLTEHICNVVEAVKGMRPGVHSTFAAMGVDSLGAVMFVKRLSDSLEGFRIDPTVLFSPGMSIAKFAVLLEEKMATEKPVLLQTLRDKLSVSNPEDVEAAKTTESGISDPDADDDYDIEEDPMMPAAVDMAFDELVASNRLLLEGMRGVFAFMVLWDHYHEQCPELRCKLPDAITADTSLFVIITGFTTAIQLRSVAKYATIVSADDNSIKRVLVPREAFRWGHYLITRIVGIFPILWVALLLSAPWWHLQLNPPPYAPDIHTHPSDTDMTPLDRTCTILYVFGMQSWYRPQCHFSGPNAVLYSSIIFNVFIIYAFIRWIFIKVQEELFTWKEPDFELPCLHKKAIPEDLASRQRDISSCPDRTWKQFIGNMALILSYNRTYTVELAWMVTFVYGSLILFICLMMFGFGNISKNAITFIGYFMSGALIASLVECWNCALWNEKLRRQQQVQIDDVDDAMPNPLLGPSPPTKRTQPPTSSFIFTFDHIFGPIARSTPVGWMKKLVNYLFSFLFSPDQTPASHPPSSFPASSSGASVPSCVVPTFWRFFPDMLAVMVALLSSGLGKTDIPPFSVFMSWGGFQLVVCAYILVAFCQRGDARQNISRVFLESPIMGLLGYMSYTVYILQRLVLEWWYPFISASIILGYPTIDFAHTINPKTGGTFDSGMGWFNNNTVNDKVLMILCLLFICWVLQKFFQDMFVVWVYGKISSLSIWSKCRKAFPSYCGSAASAASSDDAKGVGGGTLKSTGSYSNIASGMDTSVREMRSNGATNSIV